jgi:HEPN domain-containing protein
MSLNPSDAPDGSVIHPAVDGFGDNVINSVFDVFVAPELARRKLVLERDEITKVVVELNPDRRRPRVWINDRAKIVVHVQATREIAAGEEVTEVDFDEVLAVVPQDVGPNSGYVCFATIKGKQFVKFDFRYNKQRVTGLLQRAQEFLDTARECAGVRPAVACDLAFSAAELSVQAQMLLMQERTKSHSQRRDWLESWAEHDNAPTEHPTALRELHKHRAAGRYADAPFVVDPIRLDELLHVVEAMIATATARSG